MRISKLGFLSLALLALPSTVLFSQTSTNIPKLTDLFSPDEFKIAGLSKLTPEEIASLNAALFRVMGGTQFDASAFVQDGYRGAK